MMIFFSITLWACTCHIIEGGVVVNQVIDLTHDIANGYTLQWPADPVFTFNVGFRGVTEGGFYYETNDFSQAEHSGTHTDAPAHFAKVPSSVLSFYCQNFMHKESPQIVQSVRKPQQ